MTPRKNIPGDSFIRETQNGSFRFAFLLHQQVVPQVSVDIAASLRCALDMPRSRRVSIVARFIAYSHIDISLVGKPKGQPPICSGGGEDSEEGQSWLCV